MRQSKAVAVLEGTRPTWKIEVAFALNEYTKAGGRKYRYPSPVVSGEWCGFTNTPWGRGLINFNPDEEAKALETCETWFGYSRCSGTTPG